MMRLRPDRGAAERALTKADAMLQLIPIVLSALLAQSAATPQDGPPRILYDVSPRAIEYQLGRLNSADLVRLERNETDVKYRPVYYELLTRKGLGREYFDEALAALTKMDGTSRTRVLLEGLSKLDPDDSEGTARLLQVLLGQPSDALRAERDTLLRATETAASPLVLRGAYGALLVAEGNSHHAWQIASSHDGHVVELLRAVPHLPSSTPTSVRAGLASLIAQEIPRAGDPSTRAAALSALASARPDASTFTLLASEVTEGDDAEARAAAVRALHRIPRSAWPADRVEPLVRAIVAGVAEVPPNQRTNPATVEAIQLGGKLSEALPDAAARALRRELRGLGVQIVRIEAVPEQMLFDLKWFAVEAGKPVQIVLYNPDAMSHNLLIGMPGSLKEIGALAAAMSVSSDPEAKAYVPDTPLVLHATRLLNWGESARLNFTAPAKPGEYTYVCTFPGHWVRMYGVMLVVKDLEAWEANPTVPTDPMTSRPFATQRVLP
jgi:azurin/DNA-binding transcriptional ArsR family regulator